MGEIFHEGGWPMYPILSLGGTALVLALRQAFEPQRRQLALVVGLTAATILLGLFGTAVGLSVTIRHITELPPSERWIVLIGLREALNCLELALLLSIPTVLAATVGAYRAGAREPTAA